MRKSLLLCIILSFIVINVYSQSLQNLVYNDGILLAYIEPRTSTSGRSDFLLLRNLSDQEIIVTYRFRAVNTGQQGNTEIRTRDQTLRSGEQYRENGYIGMGGNYVDSFAIYNISISTQTGPVPIWAQGSWQNESRTLGIRITSTQLIYSGSTIVINFSYITGEVIAFGSYDTISRGNTEDYIILRTLDTNRTNWTTYRLYRASSTSQVPVPVPTPTPTPSPSSIVTVPYWAQGTWWTDSTRQTGGIRITSTQLIFLDSGYTLDITRESSISNNTLWFGSNFTINIGNSQDHIVLGIYSSRTDDWGFYRKYK